MAWEAQVLFLAERMGWTLDYVEGLDSDRVFYILGQLEAEDKARHSLEKAAMSGSGGDTE